MFAAIRRACSVSAVSFQSVGGYLRRPRPRVQIAKAAITGEYITQMVARLECGVLAVPIHSAGANVYHRAPRSITTSPTRTYPQACYCRNDGDSSRQSCEFRRDHRDPSLTRRPISGIIAVGCRSTCPTESSTALGILRAFATHRITTLCDLSSSCHRP